MLEKGFMLDSRYEVISQIGQGGMSYVYKALDTKLNRYVALKVLKEEFSSDDEFVQKFRQEAQSVGSLVHPNIVAAYDAVDEGELHYIVMELVEGRSLKVRIQHRGMIGNDSALEIAIQTAEGIAAAHKNGIIHRDIKPQNILISRDGTVKVADFGIAKAVTGETISTAVLGSAHYVSPEQAKKGVSDARSDIYSLGITMYEMVTGTLPFDGENTVSVVMAHINKPMVPPEQLNPELYPALNDIILKATRKNPADRYQTAEEMIADLKRCMQDPFGDFVFPEVPEDKSKESELQKHKKQAEAGKNKAAVDRKVILSFVGIAVVLIVVIIAIFFNRNGLQQSETRESIVIAQGQSGLSGSESIEITEGRVMKNLIGITEESAIEIANADMLKLIVQSRVYNDTYAAGIVIGQDPEAGSDVKSGDSVYITVSLGSELDYVLKSLKGMTVEEATRRLASVEVSVLGIEYKFSNDVPEGCVIGYIYNDDPNSETSAAAADGSETSESEYESGNTGNRAVRLLVSAGKESEGTHMPSLIGLQVSEAASVLESNGLALGTIEKVPEGEERTGLITAQSVAQDAPVKKGTKIDVRVNWEPGDILSYELTETVFQDPNEEDNLSPEFWYGSIDNVYTVGTSTGPSGQTIVENIGIRLHQRLDDSDEYSVIAEPRPISGGTRLPVSYRVIRGAKGVPGGIVEVYDADTDEVLQSYPITFYPLGQ